MIPVDITRPEISLRLDLDGTVRGVTLSDTLAETGATTWMGAAWRDTTTDEGAARIDRLITDARTGEISVFQRITQCFPDGQVIAIDYTTVRLGADAGILAIGRRTGAVSELEARVTSAERAAANGVEELRALEAQYRALFETSGEAILILRVNDFVVMDANHAATKLLGANLKGREVLATLPSSDRAAVRRMLADVRDQGVAYATAMHHGQDKGLWELRASLVNGATDASLVLHITEQAPQSNGMADTDRGGNTPFMVDDLVQRLPEALVVTDLQGNIQLVNGSFLEMAQLGVANAAIGQNLGRWLRGLGADQKLLSAKLLRYGTVRRFRSVIEGELGTEIQVDVSGAVDSAQQPAFMCMMIRDATGQQPYASDSNSVEKVLATLSDQVGQSPLRDLVQDTVKVLEQHYIQAALRLTGGNRTAAADMLGLSRQSLYVKLNRYGLDPTTVEGDGYAY